MPTNLITIGTTAANSADVVVLAGDAVTVCLKDAAGPKTDSKGVIDVLVKDDAGQYFKVDQITWAEPAMCITAPGTYRFSRRAGDSCGLFQA